MLALDDALKKMDLLILAPSTATTLDETKRESVCH